MEVACYLSDWVSRRSASLAPRTVECYTSVIDRHISPALAGVDLAFCRPDLLRQLVAGLVNDGHERTAQLAAVLLRAALAAAVHDGLLAASPAADLVVPSHHAARPRWWSEDELQAFVLASAASPWRLAWLLALACGLRRGELAGLRWSDVDFPLALLHICNQRQRVSRAGILDGPPKSDAGYRDIPLAAPLPELLRDELHRQRAAAARGAALPAYVIASKDNVPVDPHTLNRALSRDIARAGVRPINLHGLRHTMATTAIGGGVPLKTLQVMLGHAHYSTTADIYAHVSDSMARSAAAAVASIVFLPSRAVIGT